jgi:hypothetical protein
LLATEEALRTRLELVQCAMARLITASEPATEGRS